MEQPQADPIEPENETPAAEAGTSQPGPDALIANLEVQLAEEQARVTDLLEK
jgi:hypothetical protein